VDVDDALREGVRLGLRCALDHEHVVPHFPGLAERHAAVALTRNWRHVLAVERRQHRLLSEELPGEPGNLAGVAAVAVDVDVLPEQRFRTLRARETAHAPEAREVEPEVVLPERIEVAVVETADALQV